MTLSTEIHRDGQPHRPGGFNDYGQPRLLRGAPQRGLFQLGKAVHRRDNSSPQQDLARRVQHDR
jgi:hypothetical protein